MQKMKVSSSGPNHAAASPAQSTVADGESSLHRHGADSRPVYSTAILGAAQLNLLMMARMTSLAVAGVRSSPSTTTRIVRGFFSHIACVAITCEDGSPPRSRPRAPQTLSGCGVGRRASDQHTRLRNFTQIRTEHIAMPWSGCHQPTCATNIGRRFVHHFDDAADFRGGDTAGPRSRFVVGKIMIGHGNALRTRACGFQCAAVEGENGWPR